MYFLIYRSKAANEMQEADLRSLLAQSRERNKKLNITGMLVFFDNKFMQLLEGEKDNINMVYSDICKDTRHNKVVTLKEGLAKERLFPEWSMSFRVISNEEIAREPAYKDIYTPNTPGAYDLVALFNFLRGKNASGGRA